MLYSYRVLLYIADTSCGYDTLFFIGSTISSIRTKYRKRGFYAELFWIGITGDEDILFCCLSFWPWFRIWIGIFCGWFCCGYWGWFWGYCCWFWFTFKTGTGFWKANGFLGFRWGGSFLSSSNIYIFAYLSAYDYLKLLYNWG